MEQAIPNTLDYMIGGYVVFFTVLIVYLASLVIRWRNTRRDEELLEQLDKEEK